LPQNALTTLPSISSIALAAAIALAPLRTGESKVPALETDPQPELWKHTQEARVTEGQEDSFVSNVACHRHHACCLRYGARPVAIHPINNFWLREKL